MRGKPRVIQATLLSLTPRVLGPLPSHGVHRTYKPRVAPVSCRLWVTMLSPERAGPAGTHVLLWRGVEITRVWGPPSPGKPRYLPLHLALNLKFLFKN